jgi:hypothetical protein
VSHLALPRLAVSHLAVSRLAVSRLAVSRLALSRLALPRSAVSIAEGLQFHGQQAQACPMLLSSASTVYRGSAP